MLTTTVVGSYPQPRWLVDHDRLRTNAVPRVRMREMWRVAEPFLEAAQDDAVRLAVAEMEAAGVDIVTDGEQRRESYFNQFATALDGVDPVTHGTAINRVGKPQAVPRIVGPIARSRPVLLRDARFLREATRRRIKVTIPGPFTMTQLAQDEHYRDPERLAMAYAEAVNAELHELEPLVDVLQLDEPYMQAQPDRARAYAVPAINRALRGLRKTTVVHLCFGYAFSVKDKPSGYSFLPELDRCAADQISIEAAQPGLDPSVLESLPSKTMVLGVLDLGSPEAESPDLVARRIDAALQYLPASRLVLAPDCGMKHLPRALARAKLEAMVAGARLVAGAR